MHKFLEKDYKSFKRAAMKYPPGHPLGECWYGQSEEEMLDIYNQLAGLVPPYIKKILEPGIGRGGVTRAILERRKDLEYYGFDYLPEHVEHCKNTIPNGNFFVGNYWDVLSGNIYWEFIISSGVLFSCTPLEYCPLLFDLLDAAAPKGFIVTALRGRNERGGMPTELLEEKMQRVLDNSIGLKEYYFKGKRDFLKSGLLKWHRVFYVFRDGTKAEIPEIPNELKPLPSEEKGLVI